jgi:xylulokinase
VNGGHDQGCTALGLGITDPGKLLLACGTAWVFTGVRTTHDLHNIPPILDLNFHTVPQRYTISQSLGGLGASLEWWVKQAWGEFNGASSRQEMYAALNTEMTQNRPKGGLYFVPLTGGHDDPATTKTGGFVGLQLAHNRVDMARAIMESAAFELRSALEAVIKAGIPVETLWMVGGAANSPHWPIILANGTDIPIHLPQYDHWPALGAAVLAGVGTGLFKNFDQAQARIKKPHQSVMPDPGLASSYYDCFEGYKRVCRSVRQQVKQNDIPADG